MLFTNRRTRVVSTSHHDQKSGEPVINHIFSIKFLLACPSSRHRSYREGPTRGQTGRVLDKCSFPSSLLILCALKKKKMLVHSSVSAANELSLRNRSE